MNDLDDETLIKLPEYRLWANVLLLFLKDIQKDNRQLSDQKLKTAKIYHKIAIEGPRIKEICEFANVDHIRFKKTAYMFLSGRIHKGFINKCRMV